MSSQIYPTYKYKDTSKERNLIHISTDKPFYKPNEVVFIEAYVIDSVTKVPLFASDDGIYAR